MADFFKVKDNKFINTGKEDATHVLIPIHEYNGLQIAREINRRKALQQLNKAEADEYGYTLISAHKRIYKSNEIEAWHVTKQTPFSVKTGELKSFLKYGGIEECIELDLSEKFNYYIDEDPIKVEYLARHYSGEYQVKISDVRLNDILKVVKDNYQSHDEAQKRYSVEGYEYYKGDYPNRSMNLAIWEWLMENNWAVSFGIDDISLNFRKGVVNVSYWTTSLH